MSESTSPSQDAPIPPRFWWLKRIASLVVVAVMAAVVLNWWWISAADRRYREVIDSARARGEPILPDDFDAAPVPEEQNKAIFLRDAVKAINKTPELVQFESSYDSYVPLHEDQLGMLKQLVAANKQALILARRARLAPGVDWQTPMRTPVITAM